MSEHGTGAGSADDAPGAEEASRMAELARAEDTSPPPSEVPPVHPGVEAPSAPVHMVPPADAPQPWPAPVTMGYADTPGHGSAPMADAEGLVERAIESVLDQVPDVSDAEPEGSAKLQPWAETAAPPSKYKRPLSELLEQYAARIAAAPDAVAGRPRGQHPIAAFFARFTPQGGGRGGGAAAEASAVAGRGRRRRGRGLGAAAPAVAAGPAPGGGGQPRGRRRGGGGQPQRQDGVQGGRGPQSGRSQGGRGPQSGSAQGARGPQGGGPQSGGPQGARGPQGGRPPRPPQVGGEAGAPASGDARRRSRGRGRRRRGGGGGGSGTGDGGSAPPAG